MSIISCLTRRIRASRASSPTGWSASFQSTKAERNSVPRFKSDELLNFSERLLSCGGMPQDDSRLVAKLLVKAELRGYPGHGVTRIRPYLSWVKEGTLNIRERPQVVREGKTTAVI
ncbi:MAG: Ldh family oxidoreductase, partial [Deltaproteobacteria bacterium]